MRAGGFDSYILRTPRKQLNSELGEAFREELELILAKRRDEGRPANWIEAHVAFRSEDATSVLAEHTLPPVREDRAP